MDSKFPFLVDKNTKLELIQDHKLDFWTRLFNEETVD